MPGATYNSAMAESYFKFGAALIVRPAQTQEYVMLPAPQKLWAPMLLRNGTLKLFFEWYVLIFI